jgi:hypothetical protein
MGFRKQLKLWQNDCDIDNMRTNSTPLTSQENSKTPSDKISKLKFPPGKDREIFKMSKFDHDEERYRAPLPRRHTSLCTAFTDAITACSIIHDLA